MSLAVLSLINFLLSSVIGPIPLVQAQEFRLPAPGVMVHLSPPFDPPILKGIKVYPDNPFRFDFILDKGSVETPLMASLQNESIRLIKYFLASLTIPEKDLWVNLSPYEKDRIIPQSFGLTEMGRDLLAVDYMLKQITASLVYPENEIGRKFWKRIYEEAAKRYGTTNISVNTFNKVWIVPEKAVVYENSKAGTAYIVESRLKVMLEQDYLSLEKHSVIPKSTVILSAAKDLNASLDSSASPQNDVNTLGSQVVREIVIPELTKEVNKGRNFTQLRQVYNSLILATWYKKKIEDSILEQVYADKNKIAGVQYISKKDDVERIYQRYLQAFKKGVFNYIKEEEMPLGPDSKEKGILPRKYFSGGVELSDLAIRADSAMQIINQVPRPSALELSNDEVLTVHIAAALKRNPSQVTHDFAMLAEVKAGVLYHDAGLDHQHPEDTKSVFVDLKPGANLSFIGWPEVDATPFTQEELARFQKGEKVEHEINIRRENILSVRYTMTDRSSGRMKMRVIILDRAGQEHFYELSGKDTTKLVETFINLLPTLKDLEAPWAEFQITLGNQSVTPGNFTVESKKGHWKLFAATNERLDEKKHRVVVEFYDGKKVPGWARIELDHTTNKIEGIFFKPGLEDARTVEEIKLMPEKIKFILSATVIGWGNTDVKKLMMEYYPDADLRHLFRVPYEDQYGSIFYHQLARQETLNQVFDEEMVKVSLKDGDHVFSEAELQPLMNQNGYVSKRDINEVKIPGDYCIVDGHMYWVLLPAKYPISTLVMSKDGQHTAFVSVQGLSGKLGANYWTFYKWVQEYIHKLFGWTPDVVVVLENGRDPSVRQFNPDGREQIIVPGGRSRYYAAISVTPSTAATANVNIEIPDNIKVKGQWLTITPLTRELWLHKKEKFFGLLQEIKGDKEWDIQRDIVGNVDKYNPQLSFAVLDENGDPVGFSILQSSRDEDKDGYVHLSRLAVAGEFRRTNVARWILCKSFLEASHYYRHADWNPARGNTASEFYIKIGAYLDTEKYPEGIISPRKGAEIPDIEHLAFKIDLDPQGLFTLFKQFSDRLRDRAMLSRQTASQLLDFSNPRRNAETIAKERDANAGGIDLTPASNVLQSENVGEGIKFHLDSAQFAQLQSASGFTVDNITFHTLKSLPDFLANK